MCRSQKKWHMTKEDYYVFALMDLASLIKDLGVPRILEDFRLSYPKEYQQLVLGVLERLPK